MVHRRYSNQYGNERGAMFNSGWLEISLLGTHAHVRWSISRALDVGNGMVCEGVGNTRFHSSPPFPPVPPALFCNSTILTDGLGNGFDMFFCSFF